MVDHQLPAYLQNRAVPDFTDYASDGLGGALPPHVSIQGNTFTLIDATGQEFQPMPTMDVVIVDRSTVTCKRYYDKPWTPGQATYDPPMCWSSNGVGPSRDAPVPQARTCAECQWNVRGSAVSALSGASVKKCRDEYYLAILLPSMPDIMFQFVLTPGSFKNWSGYVAKFKNSNVRMSMVVTRMSFTPKVNGEVQFTATVHIDETINSVIVRALTPDGHGQKATDLLVGRLDTPKLAGLPAPVVIGQHTGYVDGLDQSGVPHRQQPLAEQVQQPGPLMPGPAVPQTATGGPAAGMQQTAPAGTEPVPAQRRRRRTAAEMQEANGTAPAGQVAPAPSVAPQAPFPHPPAQAASAGQAPGPATQGSFGIAQGQPAAANPELAGMLDDFFKD